MTYVYKIMVSLTLCRFLDHPVENKALNKFTDWLTMFFFVFLVYICVTNRLHILQRFSLFPEMNY